MKLTKRKGFNFFRSYFDVYNELESKEDKVAFMDALLERQFMGVKPTKLKGMAKFAYISQTNSIDSQVKGYEDKTKTRLNPLEPTLTHPTQPPTHGGEVTPTLQVQVEVEEKVQGKEEEEDKKSFSFKGFLIDYGFQEKLVLDWMLVRKTKKATNTQTAYNAFINELEKKPCDINEILTLIISKDWKGFKWAWVEKENPAAKDNVFSILEKEYKQITQTT